MRGLTASVVDALDRRLAPDSTAPLAVGLSGGGDSRALTLIAADWARRHGRRLAVLTVDHRLSPQSRGWTDQCAAFAARLGLQFHALAWEGEKPQAGLPAAARAARHRLLAEAARGLGARVILLGHTASDLAEAAAMRAAGATTPSPREWAPSPAWPEGRGVFLLRPMLNVSRGEIRDWLAARGEAWIDDPANDDLRFARARARARARGPGAPAAAGEPPRDLPAKAHAAKTDAAGVIRLPRASLTPRLIAIAAVCAAGTARPPRVDRVARVAALLEGDAVAVATLAGARIEGDGKTVSFMREPGELARRPPPPLALPAGSSGVWDGRFEISAARPARIVPLAGQASRLPPDQAGALRAFSPKARAALPFDLETLSCPVLTPAGAHSLVLDRLLAACGAVEREQL